MTAAIDISGLVKTYGRRRALDGVDLRVEEGSVFGFLGGNGAGKTTTLRILLGLASQTSGKVRVLGHQPASGQVQSLAGYCPDVPGFLPWMTARDVMESSASLFRMSAALARRRVDELLELTGSADTDSRVSGFSRSMRQRLGVAQALINAPQLLILDEPTSALATAVWFVLAAVLISAALLASAAFDAFAGAAGVGVFFLLALLGVVPQLAAGLVLVTNAIAAGTQESDQTLWWPVVSGLLLAGVLLAVAALVFRRRELR